MQKEAGLKDEFSLFFYGDIILFLYICDSFDY